MGLGLSNLDLGLDLVKKPKTDFFLLHFQPSPVFIFSMVDYSTIHAKSASIHGFNSISSFSSIFQNSPCEIDGAARHGIENTGSLQRCRQSFMASVKRGPAAWTEIGSPREAGNATCSGGNGGHGQRQRRRQTKENGDAEDRLCRGRDRRSWCGVAGSMGVAATVASGDWAWHDFDGAVMKLTP